MEHQGQDALVAGVGGDDANVPVAAPGAHQGHDLLRCDLALIEDTVTAAGEEPVFQFLPGLDISLEKLLPQMAQVITALFDGDDLDGDIQLLADQHQLLGGLARFFEGGMLRIDAVRRQADRHHGRRSNEMPDDGRVLAGQIRESVYVKMMIFRKIAAFQLLQQPVHLVTGIRLTGGADGLVALQDQGKLLQLLGQGTVGLFRCQAEILGRDAAPLEFIHRIQKIRQKFRSCLHGGVGFELAG